MTREPSLSAISNLTRALFLCALATAGAQEPPTTSPYRPASTHGEGPSAVDTTSPAFSVPSAASALRWGERLLDRLETIEDYECVFTKRERIGGKLGEYQQMLARVRHEPFSVYLKFAAPVSVANREVVWVDGQNQGKLLVKGVGWQAALGTIELAPDSSMAMQGNLHPISDIGMRNLARKLASRAKNDAKYDDVKLRYLRSVKVAGRSCTCIQCDIPTPRPGVDYCRSRIFVDDELSLPIRFEGYTWPDKEGGEPPLVEEYTYTGLKFNIGFTDQDFSL